MAGGGGEQDLNLVPYMDIMVNLIMFMLVVTAYIIELREAPVLAPSYTSNGGGATDEKPKPFLSVMISTKGFGILGSDSEAVPGMGIELQGGQFPYAELTQALRDYKGKYTLAENLVISADGSVPYTVVIATMDAARGTPQDPLFPGVTLGLAVQ